MPILEVKPPNPHFSSIASPNRHQHRGRNNSPSPLHARSAGNLSVAAFAGFVVSIVALLILGAFICYYLIRRRRRLLATQPPVQLTTTQSQLELQQQQRQQQQQQKQQQQNPQPLTPTPSLRGPRYSEFAQQTMPSSWGRVNSEGFEAVELYGGDEAEERKEHKEIVNPSYEEERRRRYYERLARGMPAEDAMSVNDDTSWADPVANGVRT
ncbi:MAG: hypothetical protein M1829_003899 [Trizodia sp. TS-e1964]|nr:MAG: hypothetical protein M1829_003899 [Trizodia sp. TS-e1964]